MPPQLRYTQYMETINDTLNKIYRNELKVLVTYSVIFLLVSVFTKGIILLMGTEAIIAWLSAFVLIFSAPLLTLLFLLFIPLLVYALIKFNKVSNLKKQSRQIQQSDIEVIAFNKLYRKIVYINLFFILTPLVYILLS